MNNLDLDYKLDSRKTVAAILSLSAVAVFFLIMAVTNDESLVFHHLIELSVSGATGFYWIMVLVSSLFAGIYLMAVQRQKENGPSRLLLTPDYLVIPATPFGSKRKIELVKIRSISEVSFQKFQMTELRLDQGRVVLSSHMFASPDDYVLARNFLKQRIPTPSN